MIGSSKVDCVYADGSGLKHWMHKQPGDLLNLYLKNCQFIAFPSISFFYVSPVYNSPLLSRPFLSQLLLYIYRRHLLIHSNIPN